MDDITKRFLDSCKKLINLGEVKNNAQIALEIGTSKSAISNLENSRSNVGLKLVQDFVKRYTAINSYWLLTGEGDMISDKTKTPPTVAEGVNESYKLDDVISLLNEIKSEQKALTASNQTILAAVKKADQTAKAGTTPEQRSAAVLEQVKKNQKEVASGSKGKK